MPFDPNNSGTLRRVDTEGNPKRPSHKGQVRVGGVDYWLSAWVREAQTGRNAGSKFFSLRFEPKEKPKAPESAPDSSFDPSGDPEPGREDAPNAPGASIDDPNTPFPT